MLLDNFEWVIENVDPKLPVFLNEMRAFLAGEKKGMGAVLTTNSQQNLEDLLTIKSFEFKGSHFNNIFQYVGLTRFSREETQTFIKARLKHTDFRLSEPEMQTLFEHTGGHPEQLRTACYQLIQIRYGG